jgi:hypothetical protein
MATRKALGDLWRSMHKRCSDQNHISYRYYGAKGIRVCERWASFDNFLSDMGPRPEGATLDRKDSLGNYTPENCRWATVAEQNRNKGDTILVEIEGKTQPVGVWARERGISPQVVHYRMRHLGMTPIAALSIPASRQSRHQINWTAIRAEIK